MNIRCIFYAAALALAGCGGSEPAPREAATAAGHDAAPQPVVVPMPTTPLQVQDAGITQLKAEELASAEWTRRACSLDSVDGSADNLVLDRGQPHVFRGYLMDPDQAPPGDFQLVLKGSSNFAIPAVTGWARPDVAEFFKVPGLSSAGFEFSTTLGTVAPGDYGVVFLIRRDQSLVFCESDKKLSIR